jgi:hypothetical protein
MVVFCVLFTQKRYQNQSLSYITVSLYSNFYFVVSSIKTKSDTRFRCDKEEKKGDGRNVVLLSNNHEILFSRHNVFNQL